MSDCDRTRQEVMKALATLAMSDCDRTRQQALKALATLAVAERDIRASNTRTAPHSRG